MQVYLWPKGQVMDIIPPPRDRTGTYTYYGYYLGRIHCLEPFIITDPSHPFYGYVWVGNIDYTKFGTEEMLAEPNERGERLDINAAGSEITSAPSTTSTVEDNYPTVVPLYCKNKRN